MAGAIIPLVSLIAPEIFKAFAGVEITDPDRILALETNLLINADRVKNGEPRLYFCQDYEDIAFTIADKIELNNPGQFDNEDALIGDLDLNMFEDYDFYADIATLKNAKE